MKIKEIPEPKYHIGDTIFYLDNGKIIETKIKGIIQLCKNKYAYSSIVFNQYKYFIDWSEKIEIWGWKEEKDLFISRQQVIESL